MNINLINEVFDEVFRSNVDWSIFKEANILITGSTGYIGSMLVKTFDYVNNLNNLNLKMLLPVRNIEKAKVMFNEISSVVYCPDIISKQYQLDEKIDYMIHLAAPTQSKFLSEYPVETIETIVDGTRNVLSLFYAGITKKIINLSSMEVYGTFSQETVCEENMLGNISLTKTRSSYPVAKRLSELLCYSMFVERKAPIINVRMSQVFGPGILKDDNRVYVQFCDSILKGKDIVLRSTGESVQNFCYISDALSGIIKLLESGSAGETYNLVGDPTGMKIKDVAEMVVKEFGNGEKVVFDVKNNLYNDTSKMIVSNKKIKSIGWSPKHDIVFGYKKLIYYLK